MKFTKVLSGGEKKWIMDDVKRGRITWTHFNNYLVGYQGTNINSTFCQGLVLEQRISTLKRPGAPEGESEVTLPTFYFSKRLKAFFFPRKDFFSLLHLWKKSRTIGKVKAIKTVIDIFYFSFFPSWSVVKLYTFLLLDPLQSGLTCTFPDVHFPLVMELPSPAARVTSHLALWPSWIRQDSEVTATLSPSDSEPAQSQPTSKRHHVILPRKDCVKLAIEVTNTVFFFF